MLRQIEKKSNSNCVDFEKLQEAGEKVLPQVQCPYCGRKGDFIRWGSYFRNAIELEEICSEEAVLKASNQEKVHCRQIRVQRYRCRECLHTHALLCAGIVPYRQFVLQFILAALAEHAQTGAVTEVCRKYDIAPRTLYRWKKILDADLVASGSAVIAADTWLSSWEEQLTRSFLQTFLLANMRLLMERLRPTRPVQSSLRQKLPCRPAFLLWPQQSS